ncbi:hypothetical protein [Pseudomonas sp. PLMAX]|uniref:hypothetical protein n=1 Tax=Pseudomonas sp. PLMAX TaxID=2201998 RepID=UPI0038B8F310
MKIKKDDVDEMYGRMMESCDIAAAIQSGQLKSLDDVLSAVKKRSESISQAFSEGGLIGGRPVIHCERELVRAQLEAAEPDVVMH